MLRINNRKLCCFFTIVLLTIQASNPVKASMSSGDMLGNNVPDVASEQNITENETGTGNDTTEGDTIEDGTTEGDTTEGDTTGDGTTEGATTEGDTTGDGTTGDGTPEGDTTEGDTTEGDTTGDGTTEGDTTGDSTTEGDTTGDNTTGNDTTIENTSGNDITVEDGTENGTSEKEDISDNDTGVEETVSGNDTTVDEVVSEKDNVEETVLSGGGLGNDTLKNDVSGNDVSGNDVSGNDVSGNDVSGNDVSGNDVSGNDVSGNDIAQIAEDVITVTLPTEFKVTMFYEDIIGKGFIQSQDIVMINESNFPVNINISSVEYQVNRERADEKEVELSMVLKQYGKEDITYPLVEEGENIELDVPLEKKKQETNTKKLLRQSEKTFAGTVESADYAIINLKGIMGTGNWKDGDINVRIVYEIERAEELSEKMDG